MGERSPVEIIDRDHDEGVGNVTKGLEAVCKMR